MSRSQQHCRHCGTMTLHELDPSHVNHVLHLLVSVFLLGLWLPVWFLLSVFAPDRKVRCLTCGQILGGQTQDDRTRQARMDAQLAAAAEAARAKAARDAGKFAAATGRTIGRTFQRSIEWIGLGLLNVLETAGRMLQQIDAILWKLAGEDVFMVWFCRCLMVLTMVAVSGGVIYGITRVAL